jgi:hypothetical protein
MNRRRVASLLKKEWMDLRRNPGALVPVAMVALLAMALPLVIVFGLPAWTGEPLNADSDLARVSELAGAPEALSGEARVQFFLLQQFLLLFLLTPITGARRSRPSSCSSRKWRAPSGPAWRWRSSASRSTSAALPGSAIRACSWRC